MNEPRTDSNWSFWLIFAATLLLAGVGGMWPLIEACLL